MAATIMVVEDDEELNELLHYNLTRAGFDVMQFRNGLEAIEALQSARPDLILLDIMLPGADGWEICRFRATDPDLQRIPVIVFTAKSAYEYLEQAREFNLAGRFTKPYATADVIRHVEKVLAAEGRQGSR